ncbi:MAG: hypothetical protein KAR40_07625 [Candidatus Sabulitectum sp.]|nr:hypothetical protein [Candidatus Sabulitectum sp.]
MTTPFVTVGLEKDTGDVYGISTFEEYGVGFLVTCSREKGNLDGPFLTLQSAVNVFAERCVLDGIVIENWSKIPLTKAFDNLVNFPQTWMSIAFERARSMQKAELVGNQIDRDIFPWSVLDEIDLQAWLGYGDCDDAIMATESIIEELRNGSFPRFYTRIFSDTR